MSRRTWFIGALVATAMGVSAQPGLAGTVGVSNGRVVFVATDQAPNTLRLTRRPGKIRVSDLAANVAAGPGCTAVGSNVVVCSAAPIRSASSRWGRAPTG